MMKIAKEDGYLIFDIMDRKSGYFAKYVCRYLRHAAKKVIGLESTHSKLYFYSGRKLERLLAREHVAFKRYHENQITKSTDRFNTPKRIYICRRQS